MPDSQALLYGTSIPLLVVGSVFSPKTEAHTLNIVCSSSSLTVNPRSQSSFSCVFSSKMVSCKLCLTCKSLIAVRQSCGKTYELHLLESRKKELLQCDLRAQIQILSLDYTLEHLNVCLRQSKPGQQSAQSPRLLVHEPCSLSL